MILLWDMEYGYLFEENVEMLFRKYKCLVIDGRKFDMYVRKVIKLGKFLPHFWHDGKEFVDINSKKELFKFIKEREEILNLLKKK